MGVPGLFFWFLKNYNNKTKFMFTKGENLPNTINKDLKEIDYLLIDANSLFHPESFKTIEENPNMDIDELEEKMMLNITKYLIYIINHVKPRKGI